MAGVGRIARSRAGYARRLRAGLYPVHVTESPDAGTDAPQHRYTAELAGEIERAWQQRWADSGTFNVPNPVGSLAAADGAPVPADKMFVQDMFPYPSGEGLHVGHPLGYIATDVYARYYRMTGRNVLHALGSTRSGCPPSSMRSRPVPIRARGPRRTSSTSGGSWAASGWATMPAAASPPPTSTSTSGPSGSSCRSTTPGSTRPAEQGQAHRRADRRIRIR